MTEIGCIADDYTGGTDVAAGLRRAGLRVALVFGVPTSGQELPPCDAAVVAMKFRTTSVEKASQDVAAAYGWLTSHGVQRFYYKYCSTFDSTPEGNIGPITDLLLQLTGMRTSVICPSSPVHHRTVYQGHLFVGDRLLSESPLRRHPLTPMTDPDLVRFLAQQTAGRVGLVSWADVAKGPSAVREAVDLLARSGVRHVVTDAISAGDLRTVVSAIQDRSLLTGGAGLAEAWAELVHDRRVQWGGHSRRRHVVCARVLRGTSAALPSRTSPQATRSCWRAAAPQRPSRRSRKRKRPFQATGSTQCEPPTRLRCSRRRLRGCKRSPPANRDSSTPQRHEQNVKQPSRPWDPTRLSTWNTYWVPSPCMPPLRGHAVSWWPAGRRPGLLSPPSAYNTCWSRTSSK